ncbi:MAG TPA: MFS transporter [Abditibacteriaceae bacterium]|jgi:MFS family permease
MPQPTTEREASTQEASAQEANAQATALEISPSETASPQSAWAPLRHATFRALWIAALFSNVGSWMHDVGAGWLMTTLAPSPQMVALVQAAGGLPMLLLSLPAGALADVVDRRRQLIAAQAWMLCVAGTLAVLTYLHIMSPWILLLFTFCMGVGGALTAPAWMSSIPEMVPRSDLRSAVTLGGVAMHGARAIGPALGGLIISRGGPQATFALNALSFMGVLIVFYRWKRETQESVLPSEHVMGAVRAGWRYVRHDSALQTIVARTVIFISCAAAQWGLLPLLARREAGLSAAQYGILLGCGGIGAVAGATLLPRLRARYSNDVVLAATIALYGLASLGLALTRQFVPMCCIMLAGGIAWITVMSTFNAAAITVVPDWVRSRAAALQMIAFQGGMALGAAFWGAVAQRSSIQTALLWASVGQFIGIVAALRLRLSGEAPDLSPSQHWPSPHVAEFYTGIEDSRYQPVLVTVEYCIAPERSGEFAAAMQKVGRSRRRDGALRWGLFRDLAEPGRYVESFMVESWAEHLRQHERVTQVDRELEEQAYTFHIGTERPRVSHLIADCDAGGCGPRLSSSDASKT